MTEYGGERQTTPAHVSDPAAGHERSDVTIGPLIAVAVVLTIGTAVVFVVLTFVMFVFERSEQRTDAPMPSIVEPPAPPAGPPLQPTFDHHPTLPSEDVVAMNRREAEILGSTGWVDRDRGIARIPIDEAMKLLAQQQQTSKPAATAPADQEARP